MNYMLDRVALIGFGRIAEVLYLPHLVKLSKKVIVCESNLERAEIAKQFANNVEVVHSFESLPQGVSNEVNLAVNLTPPESHFSLNEALIDKNWNVYSEKPACNNLTQWKILVKKAQSMNVVICSAPTTAYSTSSIMMLSDINKGVLGNISEIHGKFVGAGPYRRGIIPKSRDWLVTGKLGVISDLAPYLISPMVEIFGDLEIDSWHKNDLRHTVRLTETNEVISASQGSTALGTGRVDKALLSLLVSYRPFYQDVVNEITVVGDKEERTYDFSDTVVDGKHKDSKIVGMLNIFMKCLNDDKFHREHIDNVSKTIQLTVI